MKLTPEDLQRVQSKKIANVLRKIHSGKTVTAREDALLAAATADGEIDAAGFVGTWDELGQRLGVSRRAIQDWRHDPRYAGEIEKRRSRLERADGRHCVAEWLKLMVEFGLKRADENTAVDEDRETEHGDGADVVQAPRVGGTAVDWKKANLALDHRRKANDIAVQEGTLLIAAELEAPLGATLAAIQTKLAQFPDRVARFVTGLRDIQEVSDRLRDEMDADLTDLNAARYVEASIPEIVASIPFDEESTRLFSLVTFDGQDRSALLQLIAHVAAAAVAQIGRKTLAQLRQQHERADEEISDPATGQVTDEAADREANSKTTQLGKESAVAVPAAHSPAGHQPAHGAAPAKRAPARLPQRKPGASGRGAPGKSKGDRKTPAQPAAAPDEVEATIRNDHPTGRRRKLTRRPKA